MLPHLDHACNYIRNKIPRALVASILHALNIEETTFAQNSSQEASISPCNINMINSRH